MSDLDKAIKVVELWKARCLDCVSKAEQSEDQRSTEIYSHRYGMCKDILADLRAIQQKPGGE